MPDTSDAAQLVEGHSPYDGKREKTLGNPVVKGAGAEANGLDPSLKTAGRVRWDLGPEVPSSVSDEESEHSPS
jgi:hypothetical protein